MQLVVRNSVDQSDEQTPGANKRTLLGGERGMLVPEPGLGNPNPKPAPLQTIKVLASGQNIDKPKNDREVERSIRPSLFKLRLSRQRNSRLLQACPIC